MGMYFLVIPYQKILEKSVSLEYKHEHEHGVYFSIWGYFSVLWLSINFLSVFDFLSTYVKR